jgi:hypothetical protein
VDAGDTLLVIEPGTSYDSHLWIIISDPRKDAERVVIVSMTSYRADKDQACVLDVGDHPYIRKPTCINYIDAKVVSIAAIESLIASGKVSGHHRCSAALLTRIRAGIPDSRITMERYEILVEQGLVDAE